MRAVWLCAVALLCAVRVHAQSVIVEEPGYTPTLTFDTATVRQAPPPTGDVHVTVTSPPHSSRLEVNYLPMKALLQMAYGYDMPIVGLPEWASNTFYTVQARSDEAADARLAKLTENEVRLEKRNAVLMLLAERMGLKTHTETRNTAIYNLVVAKGGLKMKLSPALPAPADGGAPPPRPPADVQAHGSQHGLEFVVKDCSMLAVGSILSSMVETPVVDKTGVTGTYNFTLQVQRQWSERDPDSWPVIYTAVQDQLGLKLEPVRENVPNLVVDAIAKPGEN